MSQKFLEQVAIMRGFLNGRKYYQALEALQYAFEKHNGFRKDGKTPEFSHQIEIAFYILTLEPHLLYPQETITSVFLHDVCEDYDIEFDEIKYHFGDNIAQALVCLSKKTNFYIVNINKYFERISHNAIASIVKPADRLHNFNSMVGVFTPEKQLNYIDEGEIHFLTMIKNARKRFPHQEMAYRNVGLILKTQINLIRQIHNNTQE